MFSALYSTAAVVATVFLVVVVIALLVAEPWSIAGVLVLFVLPIGIICHKAAKRPDSLDEEAGPK